MLGGNNENSIPQGLLNDSQFQFQTNTSLDQHHLLGAMRAGCAMDPVNYFANEPARETEINNNIQRQQKLQMSLNYNYNDNSIFQDEVPKENLVSTGLRLSYGGYERNSSVTSAITTPVFQSPSDNIRVDLQGQKNELDQFIKFQADQMAKGVRELKQRHLTSFVTALERNVSKKLQEKDQEIERMNKKNQELVEKIKQVAVEAQNWHYRANYNESVVNALKVNLQQAMSNGHNNNAAGVVVGDHHQVKEGFGDSEIDDEAASYNYLNIPGMASVEVRCKSCNAKEVSVLLLPCRHLSLCKDCDVFTSICPVCQSLKTSSVQVFSLLRRIREFRVEKLNMEKDEQLCM